MCEFTSGLDILGRNDQDVSGEEGAVRTQQEIEIRYISGKKKKKVVSYTEE